jgi:hyaluronoglucosaminidase
MVGAVVAGALVIPASPSSAGAMPSAPALLTARTSTASLPAVYPVPRSMTRNGSPVPIPTTITLVTGAGTDASALSSVEALLRAAGATHLVTVSDARAPAPGGLTVYLGGTDVNAQTAQALAELGIGRSTGLPAEGYVLGVGRVRGGSVVVLDGVDAAGTYYAAQTLRQLVEHPGGGRPELAGVSVRDWPSMATRGVIEGFYGSPWSTADRLAQLDFYGANKMNTYVYSPKDDPYLRAQWRNPNPPDRLATIRKLVQRAAADHVTFTYALSPGLSVCYSSASDEHALVAKFESLWAIGVRSFAVPLDDISYTTWHCAADQAKFGVGTGGAAGAAQAYLLDEINHDFIAAHPGAHPLETVPTEYSDSRVSAYKTAIARDLNSDVVVEWTGNGVVPATITETQARTAASVYDHTILLWDNYPVNDYVDTQLLLGPYLGRDPGLANTLVGVTANPMIQAEPSKIALFDVADFTWNSAAYNPATSWNASLTAFGHGNPKVVAALHAFADVNYQTRYLDLPQAPSLSAQITTFWTAYHAGGTSAAGRLGTALTALRNAPAVLDAGLDDPAFLSEAQPWLESTTDWGNATLVALDMLQAQQRGDGSRARSDRQQLAGLVASATSHRYVSQGSTVTVTVGKGVLDTFVDDALNANTAWMRNRPQPQRQP